MSKASDAGKAFMAGVLAKIPDETLRAQVETAFNDPRSEEALVVVGAGALAQPEINRKFTELEEAQAALTTKRAELEEVQQKQVNWWSVQEPKVRAYDEIKPEYDRLKEGKDPVGVDEAALTAMRKEFGDQLAGIQREGVNLMAFMSELAVRHYAEFQEKPDLQALLADPNIGKPLGDGRTYGLVQAYETKYGPQIKERHDKVEQARIDKLVDEKLAARMKDAPGPFPLRNQAPSALDILETGGKPEDHTVDTAAALYDQLQSARG